MARQWRIEYKGALYHVYSRGNEQKDIFYDHTDCIRFLETLGEMAERFSIDIFCYVLMRNHYHILLRTNTADLSRSMQWFGATYTKRFNIKNTRSGHLFQGRFKSAIIQDETYMKHISCYLHGNPVRAGLIDQLADYPWSSYPAYAYDSGYIPEWLNTRLILSQSKAKDKQRAYRRKVCTYIREDKQLWDELKHGVIFGSKTFVERIKARYLTENPHGEIPQQKRVAKGVIDHQSIVRQAAAVVNCDIKKLQISPRVASSDRDDRDVIIYLIWKTGVCTNQEIGDIFGLSYSSVSHRVGIVKKKILRDKAFRKKTTWIKSQIKI